MGVNRHQNLIVWQLANRLAIEVVRLTESQALRSDRRFCDQLRSAARSVPANIAEGFARYGPTDFVRFLRYARGSLAELQSYLDNIQGAGLVPEGELEVAQTLSRRVGAAMTSLIRYLQSPEASQRSARPDDERS